MLSLARVHLTIAIAITLIVPTCLLGQDAKLELKLGIVVGTVIDTNGDIVPNASVELKSFDSDRRTVTTADNGFFQFDNLVPGVPYKITITAKNFLDWNSSSITLEPGQFKTLTGIQLRIRTELTKFQVARDSVQGPTEQFKAKEHQRVFGIVPNFYVSYEGDPAPLTGKMKVQLAIKLYTDPVNVAGFFVLAAIRQAANSPKYGQGWDAYGKRVGATAADRFSDIMIGDAILPSLLNQDPRFLYQGTGTTGSRIRHAIFSPFLAKSASGKAMPNYSSLGGDLASASLSNFYYPSANRGAGLVFGNFAIATAGRIGANLAQEFIIRKFTRRAGHAVTVPHQPPE